MEEAPRTSTLWRGSRFPFPKHTAGPGSVPSGWAARDLGQACSSSKMMCSA